MCHSYSTIDRTMYGIVHKTKKQPNDAVYQSICARRLNLRKSH